MTTNCDILRPLLPLHVYDDLDPDSAKRLTEHLASCTACTRQLHGLRQTREMLDAVAVPEVHVDVSAILAATAAGHERARIRWRRRTLASLALAAGLLLFAIVRPTLRIEDGAVVVRWKEPEAVAAREIPAEKPDLNARQLEALTRLVSALAENLDARNRDLSRDLSLVSDQLKELRDLSDARYADVQKDMGVLYRAQFVKNTEGDRR
jgi:Putative zinc-finger